MRVINRLLGSHALALESQLYNSMLGGSASKTLGAIDPAKLAELERREGVIEGLVQWIRLPEPKLYPVLAELSAVVRSLYDFPATLPVWRGFDLQSPYQNTMGLSVKGLLSNSVKKGILVGSLHRWCDDRPISCTSDPEIAQAYGSVVVGLEVQPNMPGSLVITPELYAIVCARQDVAAQSQSEVILLPPVDCEFQIVKVKHEQ